MAQGCNRDHSQGKRLAGHKHRPAKSTAIAGSSRALNLFAGSRIGDSAGIPEVDGTALDVGGPCAEAFGC